MLEKAQLTELQAGYAAVLLTMKHAPSVTALQALVPLAEGLREKLDELGTTHNARVVRAQILRNQLLH